MKIQLTIKVYPYCVSFNELGYSLLPVESDWKLNWNDPLLEYFEDEHEAETFTRRKYLKMMKDYYAIFERMKK